MISRLSTVPDETAMVLARVRTAVVKESVLEPTLEGLARLKTARLTVAPTGSTSRTQQPYFDSLGTEGDT